MNLTCDYCQIFDDAPVRKSKAIGVKRCKILKKDIHRDNDICNNFILRNYFYCKKNNTRINIKICINNISNKIRGCKNCKLGKLIFKYGK